jgi:putative ABC transport system permease protein
MIVEPLDLRPTFETLVYFVLFALFIGFAAGFVPAMYFSRLNPIQALKAKATSGKSRFTLRKVLIAGQFTLSLGFIMAVVVVLSQYRYVMNFDFGFDQANVLDVELQGAKPQIIKNEFSKISSVQRISMSSHVMGTSSSGREMVHIGETSDSVEAFQMSVDENYFANLDLSLVAGKNFGSEEAVNRKHIIVNEVFAKRFKTTDVRDVIDRSVFILGKEYYIAGVVKDFHYLSLQEPIREFYFVYNPESFRYANVKLQSKDMFGDISEMESIWKSLGSENKFKAEFFDDEIKDTYSFYFSMVKICGSLGVLAITISCLGLLGMVVFTVENRMKEIGVRKVMGSSTAQITLLLSKDYLKLLAIAAVIAIPVTYWVMQIYYENAQAYRATIGATEIVISLLIMIVLGGLTIFSQTVKAAKANPVDTLRYE